ncbi:MAG: TauD/TfdA family dioxygenase, partial [Myxococcota bacterium]|nr:TauD/TfdA family dioxygenase [Myxococcota bacterium]
MSGSQVDFLHKTLLEHQVLCFPDQDLTPQDLLRLGRSFGAPQVNPIMGGIKEIPQVVRVEKRAGDSDIFTGRARLFGSYLVNPPKMGFCQNPDSGLGFDLAFASLTQAWRGLSEDFQAILTDLSASRSGLLEFGPEAVDP